jgi:hypothetical protein
LIVRRRWHFIAQVLALLALFANAAPLPALHASSAHYASASPDIAAPNHRHHLRGETGGEQPAFPAHQACHFCRLLGAALPPPPAASVEIVFHAEAATWPELPARILRHESLRANNLPRAPPLSA